MSTNTLQAAYIAAAEYFGEEAADKAAAEGVEAFNVNALAGASLEDCEAEQMAAFKAAL